MAVASSYKVQAGLDVAGAFAQSGVISPAQITANQNDYDPAGLSTASILLLTSDASGRTITGIAGGSDGRVLILINANSTGGTVYIALSPEDTGSTTAANRIAGAYGTVDLFLYPGQALTLVYDSSISRWRPVPNSGAQQHTLAPLSTGSTFQAGAALLFYGDISPTQLTSNTDNWNPTNLGFASTIRIDASTAIDLTGIAGGSDGRVLFLMNISSSTITLKHDVTSTTTNRFFCPSSADFALLANAMVVLMYDSTSQRWRVIGSSSSGGSASFAGTWKNPGF